MQHADTIAEFDVNPLIVSTQGAVAVDARARLEQAPTEVPQNAPDLGALLAPNAVAVAGASANNIAHGNLYIRQLKAFGFAKPIYPIHPSAETIAYCFHSVAGFSKVSTYSGDGTNDFSKEITVGFQPQFVLLKAAIGGGNYEQWNIIDSARGDENKLYASANTFENGGNSNALYGTAKLTSTGFQVAKGSNSHARDFNYSGSTYLYMAFA